MDQARDQPRVSWTQRLTQIHVDGPEDPGPGKRREVEEMTNEKGGTMTET